MCDGDSHHAAFDYFTRACDMRADFYYFMLVIDGLRTCLLLIEIEFEFSIVNVEQKAIKLNDFGVMSSCRLVTLTARSTSCDASN
jgi:hypothetical protein